MMTTVKTALKNALRFVGRNPADRRRREVLDSTGGEMLDSTPMQPPIGYNPQPSMVDIIREQIRRAGVEAAAEGAESFEEADDFDVQDDFEPTSPYEAVFEPEVVQEPLGKPSDPPADGPGSPPADPAKAGSPAPAQGGPATTPAPSAGPAV